MDYIVLYRNYLKVQRLAPSTIKCYCSIVKRFLQWCNYRPNEVTKHQLVSYLSSNTSGRTLEQQIGSLSKFYIYILNRPWVVGNLPNINTCISRFEV